MTKRFFVAAGLTWVLAAGVSAEEPAASSTLPATQANTQAATRPEVPLPPGMQRLAVGGRIAYVAPEDAEWVLAVMKGAAAITRPTTMPEDLLARVKGSAATVVTSLAQEVDLPESELAPAYQQWLIKPLEDLSAATGTGLPVWVVSKERLKAVVKSGTTADGRPWSHPRFRYNRIADDVAVNMQLNLAEGMTEAEQFIPAMVDDKLPVDKRQVELTRIFGELETAVARARSNRGLYLVQRGMIQVLGEKVVVPLKLPPEQQWFGLGLIGVVSARYTAVITNTTRDRILAQMTEEPRGVPFRAAAIDVAHPIDLTTLKPAYAMQYIEATRRKAVVLVDRWMDLAGSQGLAQTLRELRASHPTGLQGLRDLVKRASGAELPIE